MKKAILAMLMAALVLAGCSMEKMVENQVEVLDESVVSVEEVSRSGYEREIVLGKYYCVDVVSFDSGGALSFPGTSSGAFVLSNKQADGNYNLYAYAIHEYQYGNTYVWINLTQYSSNNLTGVRIVKTDDNSIYLLKADHKLYRFKVISSKPYYQNLKKGYYSDYDNGTLVPGTYYDIGSGGDYAEVFASNMAYSGKYGTRYQIWSKGSATSNLQRFNSSSGSTFYGQKVVAGIDYGHYSSSYAYLMSDWGLFFKINLHTKEDEWVCSFDGSYAGDIAVYKDAVVFVGQDGIIHTDQSVSGIDSGVFSSLDGMAAKAVSINWDSDDEDYFAWVIGTNNKLTCYRYHYQF